jgi:hypothetical protein
MKIQIRNVAILGLFFVLAIASAQAQTPSRAEVNIPFDFSAGTAKLKAGVYTVKRMTGNALAIRSADGKTTALVNAPLTLGSRDSKAGQRLVFNKYGDEYFLSQIWLRVDTGRQLFPAAGEARAARDYKLGRGYSKPERREIALR